MICGGLSVRLGTVGTTVDHEAKESAVTDTTSKLSRRYRELSGRGGPAIGPERIAEILAEYETTTRDPRELAERYSRYCKPSEDEVRNMAEHGMVEATVTLAAAKRRARPMIVVAGVCIFGITILIMTMPWWWPL